MRERSLVHTCAAEWLAIIFVLCARQHAYTCVCMRVWSRNKHRAAGIHVARFALRTTACAHHHRPRVRVQGKEPEAVAVAGGGDVDDLEARLNNLKK